MKRDFLKELQNIIKTIDNEQLSESYSESTVFYNIRKRSLPVGTDKPIVLRVTDKEADFLLMTVFKAKVVDESIVYYCKVKDNASNEELSVYYNPPETRQITSVN